MSTELSTNTTPARGLALASFEDAFRFAKMVAASDFAPKDFRGKPESCLLAIQHGSEIGLSPMQALQNIACINGRPAIWSESGRPVAEKPLHTDSAGLPVTLNGRVIDGPSRCES